MNNLIEYFKTSECDNEEQPNNQLFSKKYPPFDLVRKVISLLTNTTILTNDIHYEFTLKLMTEKKIIERIEPYIIELKQYYLMMSEYARRASLIWSKALDVENIDIKESREITTK